MELVINRGGRTIERSAILQSLAGTTEIAEIKRGEMFTELGAEMATVSEEKADELNIEGGVQITKLYAGILRRDTDVREGFIITRVNTKSVTTVEELENILQKTEGGVMLEGVYEDIPGEQYYAFGMKR